MVSISFGSLHSHTTALPFFSNNCNNAAASCHFYYIGSCIVQACAIVWFLVLKSAARQLERVDYCQVIINLACTLQPSRVVSNPSVSKFCAKNLSFCNRFIKMGIRCGCDNVWFTRFSTVKGKENNTKGKEWKNLTEINNSLMILNKM